MSQLKKFTPHSSYISPFFINLFLIFTFLQCSTIQLQEGITFTRDTPEYIPFVADKPKQEVDANDHKLRKRNKFKPDATILFDKESFDSFLTEKESSFFKNAILRQAAEQSFNLKQPPSKELISSNDLKEFFKKNDVDFYLVIHTSQENPTRFTAIAKDSVNDSVLGELAFEWKLENDADPSSVYIWKNNSRPKSLNVSSSPIPRLVYQPSKEDWKRISDDSIEGIINIFSSSTDTIVLLDGKSIGEAPIRSLRLLNGPHRVQFKKPGVEPRTEFFQIRSGDSKTIYHEWEDDLNSSSLQVFSFPQGLNVWVDGEKKGVTNQYMNEVVPGAYSIELSKEFLLPNGATEELLYSEAKVKLDAKDSKAIALPYYMDNALQPVYSEFWKPSGRKGFSPITKPALGFESDRSHLVPGDYGYYSSYIFPDYLEIEGVLPVFTPSQESRVGFLFYMGEVGFLLENRGDSIGLFKIEKGVSSHKSLAVWKFKDSIDPEERIFMIRTKPEDKKLQIRLGNREVLETDLRMDVLWRMGILTRGEAFYKGAPLGKLKILYPDMADLEKKRERD